MSASTTSFTAFYTNPQVPDLGSTRRTIAAAIAVAMVVVGLSGWTHIDTHDATVAATTQQPR